MKGSFDKQYAYAHASVDKISCWGHIYKRAVGDYTLASLVKWILRHLLMVCTQFSVLVQPGSIPGWSPRPLTQSGIFILTRQWSPSNPSYLLAHVNVLSLAQEEITFTLKQLINYSWAFELPVRHVRVSAHVSYDAMITLVLVHNKYSTLLLLLRALCTLGWSRSSSFTNSALPCPALASPSTRAVEAPEPIPKVKHLKPVTTEVV